MRISENLPPVIRFSLLDYKKYVLKIKRLKTANKGK